MEKMRIPKFETETDEANWLYDHREELATEFCLRPGRAECVRER
jgi:hypothetical protein